MRDSQCLKTMVVRALARGIFVVVFLIVVLVVLSLYFGFPGYDLPDRIISNSVPGIADLDKFLSEEESRFVDLKPGIQKRIIWDEPTRKNRTQYAVVYLHGFSATNREISPVPELVARDLGANLFLSRLPGHGRSNEAVAEPQVRDYLVSALEAYEIGRRLGDKLVLLGTSTGGTLSTWLSTSAHDLDALVLLSPNFGPKDPMAKFLLLPGGKYLADLIVGEYYEWEPQNREQGIYWTTRYPSFALVTMMKMVSGVKKLDLSRIDVPTLVVYSENDQVVSPSEIKKTFERLGSSKKEIVIFNASADGFDHVLSGDILSPGTVEPIRKLIVDFVQGTKH